MLYRYKNECGHNSGYFCWLDHGLLLIGFVEQWLSNNCNCRFADLFDISNIL